MLIRSAICATLFALSTPAIAFANQGILLLAHNGTPAWNAEVKDLAGKVDSRTPAEVAFGMPTKSTIAAAVDRLGKRGVTEVVAVPFFLSVPIAPEDLSGHALSVRTASVGGLDAVLAEIIIRRVEETSRSDSGEALLLVGYGGDDGGKRWIADMVPVARRINSTKKFGWVLAAGHTDALSPAQQQTIRKVLNRAATLRQSIVVVYLLAPTNDDPSLKQLMSGLSYAVAKQDVVGDVRLVAWVAELAAVSPR